MKSKTRQDCEDAVTLFMGMLSILQENTPNKQMLMVGTAGNPLTHSGRPGLDQPELFKDYALTTLDFDRKWKPDIVGDILVPQGWGVECFQRFDLIHMTQVLEHIAESWKVQHALKYLIKPGGFIIVDSPWGPNSPDYHGEAGSFGDYWRISKDGMRILFGQTFQIIKIISTNANTSCLMKAY